MPLWKLHKCRTLICLFHMYYGGYYKRFGCYRWFINLQHLELRYRIPTEMQFVMDDQRILCSRRNAVIKIMFNILNTHVFWFLKDNVFVLIILCVIIGKKWTLNKPYYTTNFIALIKAWVNDALTTNSCLNTKLWFSLDPSFVVIFGVNKHVDLLWKPKLK